MSQLENRLAALFNLDGCAGFRKLLFDVLCFVFGYALFDRLRSCFNQILSFFQSQAGDFANGLDDADLVTTNCRENDIELRLLLSRSRRCAAGGRGWSCRDCCRSRTDAESLFESFNQL